MTTSQTKTFKHSGTSGDLIYSLPLVQYWGGGDFYLHLDQINWIGQHYYGALPAEFHRGRMNHADLLWLRDLMLAQPYIHRFQALDPHTTEITHNLDRFRPLFVSHPGNYIDCYCAAFGIDDAATRAQLRNTPWLTVPPGTDTEPARIVIARSTRWLPAQQSDQWRQWREQGWEQAAVFVGLQSEHAQFERATGWRIPWRRTDSALQLAQVIAASDCVVSNQTQALSMAIGLGHDQIWCEARTDLSLQRNECWFPDLPRIRYF